MATKKLDIVVFGASGFTGQFVVEYLAKTVPAQENNVTWAVAGRSRNKLIDALQNATVHTGVTLDEIPIIIADIQDDSALDNMCKQATLILNCVGPYRLYGEPVVKACVANGTHHLDISGESGFLDKMQLVYHEKAQASGAYILGSCGWDTIPEDMGVVFVKDNFKGDLNSVESYVSIEMGPSGGGLNFGTWQSGIYNSYHFLEDLKQHKELMKNALPTPAHRLKSRRPLFYSKDVDGWCTFFPNCEKSVIDRTQKFNYEVKKERPVQFNAWFKPPSLLAVAFLTAVGIVMGLFSLFKPGRYLLEQYPWLFSGGIFYKNGPSRKQIEGTTFTITLVGCGYNNKLPDPAQQHAERPDVKVIAKVTGPELAYIATPICMVEAAYVLLSEQDKIPPGGGVLTPGAAFASTSLISRLQKHGIQFDIVSKQQRNN